MVFYIKKYKIENDLFKNIDDSTYEKAIAQKKFPNFINDLTTEKIIEKIDYDFSSQEKKMTSLFRVYGN